MRRRVLLAGVLAVALASAGCAMARRALVVIPSFCDLFPWAPGCSDPQAGGGGGGAG